MSNKSKVFPELDHMTRDGVQRLFPKKKWMKKKKMPRAFNFGMSDRMVRHRNGTSDQFK